jgi:nucleoside-diphosphate-sugar epimerase
MQTLLLTGASGFVGQNLIGTWSDRPEFNPTPVSLRNGLDSLDSALDTRHWSLDTRHSSLVTPHSSLPPPAIPALAEQATPVPVSHIPYPISSELAREYPVSVIHLAGLAHDTANTSTPEDYVRINTDLTVEVYKRFLDSEARTFIYFSSVKAAADRVSGDILTEDEPPAPGTPYGQSKRAAEEKILELGIPADRRVYILRPCMMHGPGNKGNLNLLYKLVRKGLPWPLGAFDNRRSFLCIDNLIFLLEELLKGGAPSGIYNLADDEALSTNGLIRLIAESEGRKARILKCPQSLIQTAARAGDVLRLPLNTERLKKLTESYVVSNHKIKTALGIGALPLTVDTGIKKTLRSFAQG